MMSRGHLTLLDGFRGIAAVAVVLMHASLILGFDYWPAHAGLAVDFFFCLSGFVIAHAYDDAFATRRIDLRAFAGRRIIRLYPMILLGVVLGTATTVISATHGAPQPLSQVLFLSLSAALLFPGGLLLHGLAFPVDPPLWSLFFEGIANALYGLEAALGRRRSPPILFLALCGAALVAVATHYGTIRELGYEKSYWFIGGMARVVFSFLAGVMICRSGIDRRAPKIPDYVLAGILAVILFGPSIPFNMAFDLVTILVIFPALVACGARDASSPAAERLWAMLGALSYPLYAIHVPVLFVVKKLQNHILHSPSQLMVAALGLGAAVAAGAAAARLYDEPVRAWLSKQPWLRAKLAVSSATAR